MIAYAFISLPSEIKAIIVIQYEAYIDGKWCPVVRFDEAHGFFHRDVMAPSGEQEKIVEPDSDKGVALTQAIEDIKQHWRYYRKAYEDKYYGNE